MTSSKSSPSKCFCHSPLNKLLFSFCESRSYIFIVRQASLLTIRGVEPDELYAIFGICEKATHTGNDQRDASFIMGDSSSLNAAVSAVCGFFQLFLP